MMTEETKIKILLTKYIASKSTGDELSELDTLLQQLPADRLELLFAELWDEIGAEQDDLTDQETFTATDRESMLQRILQNTPMPIAQTKNKMLLKQYTYRQMLAVAAVISVLLTFSYFWLSPLIFPKKNGVESLTSESRLNRAETIVPGTEKAVLLTEGARSVVLDGATVGLIEQGEDFRVVRLETGELQYQVISKEPAEGRWHTLQTPRGGQLSFLLPDGSKVWLNAESSIRFHSTMASTERKVEISGEVYFDIAKVADKRFTVQGSFGEIEVLGTKFNVNTYTNQAQAALLEGHIRLHTGAAYRDMQPRQLAVINPSGNVNMSYKTNIEDLIAWTKGFFYFEDTDIATVGQHLSRWYNIDVQVADKSISRKITGTIDRNVKLSKMMAMLDYLGLDCTLKDNQLIINAKKGGSMP